jgi:uncharacterized peroxidase-related enzyme
MAHIQLNSDQPGIIGLLQFRPQTAGPLNSLAQALLRGDSSLQVYERELIATYVSSLNNCNFCMNSHGAVVDVLLGSDNLTTKMIFNPEEAEVTAKLRKLLAIAGKVQKGGKMVLKSDIEEAKHEGASDEEIHDTVLIAAAFCMYNRYVDGLGTFTPEKKEMYMPIGQLLAYNGYVPH